MTDHEHISGLMVEIPVDAVFQVWGRYSRPVRTTIIDTGATSLVESVVTTIEQGLLFDASLTRQKRLAFTAFFDHDSANS